MKLFLISAYILFLSTFTMAQNSLSGYVKALEGAEPLIGANIFIPDLHKGTTTNLDGYFHMDNLPKGDFLVEVGYLGFSNQVIRVEIDGPTTTDVSLIHAVIEMAEVVVTGPSASTEREMNPIPTLVQDEISSNKLANKNIIEAISKLPGMAQITTGGAVSKPVIRGLGYNRVIVLNNNIRQEGQQWGDEHGIEIDEYSVDRVEIVKGPGSLKYGSDAMAGVIHFLAPKPVDEGEITGHVMANYQSNNHLQGYSAMNAGHINGVNWLARISHKNAGNYSNPFDGPVYNSGFNELNFNGSLGLNRKWGFSRINFSRFDQSLGLVEGERDEWGRFIRPVVVGGDQVIEEPVTGEDLKGYHIGIPNQGILHQKISSNSKLFFDRSVLSLNLALQQNDRKEFEDALHPDEAELFFRLKTFNYDVQYLLPEFDDWQPSVGLNGMVQTSLNKGEEFLIPEYDLWDGGVFAFLQRSFDRLYVNGGIRYDIRQLDSKPLYLNGNEEPVDTPVEGGVTRFREFRNTFSNISASAGLSYRFSEMLTGKVNISRGFRSPNISELGSNGIHEGTFRFESGNPELKPETSLQWDAGLIYNNEHISVELGLFHNTVHNYIHLQKLNSVAGGDSIVQVDEPVPVFGYVQNDAILYGGEIVVDVHPHPLDWLHFENTSYARGKQKNRKGDERYLPFMPAPEFQSELRADFEEAVKVLRHLYFRIGLDHFFRQDQVFAAYDTETPTPAYTLIHAGMGADWIGKNGQRLFSLSIAGSNLLDVGYQSHLSRLKYVPENPATGRTGVYDMGRNISIRLVIPFKFSSAAG